MAADSLDLWMNGLHVGRWERTRSTDRLYYSREWLDGEAARPLSLSLPLNPGSDRVPLSGAAVRFYFENLIPDNERILERLRNRFGARSRSAFDLLAEIGRDCAGALQLTRSGEEPDDIQRIDAEPLTEAGVANLLRTTTIARGDEDDDAFRLSIAGAQEKTALLRHGNRWCVPRGTTPTTHLFKLPLGLVANVRADLSDSVELEWLCMRLAALLGFRVANVEIGRFEDQRVLIVERFDRRKARNGKYWLRLPQEDCCQAFGLPPEQKYESKGGPSARRILDVLRDSTDPDGDRVAFFRALVLNWLIGGTDAHAKNYSISHQPGSRFRLTPLYDVLSIYPILGRGARQIDPRKAKLAMAVEGRNRHYALHEVHRWHWVAMGNSVSLGVDVATLLDELIASLEPAFAKLASSLPEEFPAYLFDAVRTGTMSAADRLAREPNVRG